MMPGTSEGSSILESNEPLSSGDRVIRAIVRVTNQFLVGTDRKNEDSLSRTDQCRKASSAVKYFGEKSNVPVKIFDVNKLQSAILNHPNRDTFIHTFAVATVDGTQYLVDTTFGQFVQSDETIGQAGQSTGVPATNILARRLVDNGYVKLTPEVMAEYFKITSFCHHTVEPVDLNSLSDDLTSLPEYLTARDKSDAFDEYLPQLEQFEKDKI